MNCKRLSAALLALAMASTLPAFAAGDTVDAPLEDDQALLIAPAPEAEMPRVEVPAPTAGIPLSSPSTGRPWSPSTSPGRSPAGGARP